jgi:hypothetical protein
MIYFFLIKPPNALISQIYFVKKICMVRAVPLPIIRSFPLYIRHWYMSCRFSDSFQAWLVMLESCHKTCMTYISAECTVENSWWWAEELPEPYSPRGLPEDGPYGLKHVAASIQMFYLWILTFYMVNRLCICWSEKLWYYRNARCYNKNPPIIMNIENFCHYSLFPSWSG